MIFICKFIILLTTFRIKLLKIKEALKKRIKWKNGHDGVKKKKWELHNPTSKKYVIKRRLSPTIKVQYYMVFDAIIYISTIIPYIIFAII